MLLSIIVDLLQGDERVLLLLSVTGSVILLVQNFAGSPKGSDSDAGSQTSMNKSCHQLLTDQTADLGDVCKAVTQCKDDRQSLTRPSSVIYIDR